MKMSLLCLTMFTFWSGITTEALWSAKGHESQEGPLPGRGGLTMSVAHGLPPAATGPFSFPRLCQGAVVRIK